MGWLQQARRLLPVDQSESIRQAQEGSHDNAAVAVAQLMTQVDGLSMSDHRMHGSDSTKYPFAPLELPEAQLPFISADEVQSSGSVTQDSCSDMQGKNLRRLWIVIDGIVYDCSEYVSSHPGGEAVMANFNGQDCSWQFWRFHGMQQMNDFGRQLRIGRTSGIKNRYKEPTRYVGLRKLGNGEDW